MKKSLELIYKGFESSSSKTPEFKAFAKIFAKEFKSELTSVGCKDIKFNVGHFYITGFFTTLEGQAIYFSTPDVRDLGYGIETNPNNSMNQLMYRRVKDYKDYTGGVNRHARIEFCMIDRMVQYFNIH